VASAQTGGYPASPSHSVIGTNPDGTPRYGSEPGEDARPSTNTVGRSGSDARGDHSAAPSADDGQKEGARHQSGPGRDRR
jgi:hypothetical protein